MGRKPRPLDRATAVRDAKLLVIATEDSKASPRYFEDLAAEHRNSKVQVKVLQRDMSASAPKYILKMLDDYATEYALEEEDELWLVIDVDRWGEQILSEVARLCDQKGHHLAVSNPCIELWFLLHLRDLSNASETEQTKLLENKKQNNRTALEQAILAELSHYNKSNLNTDDFVPHVTTALSHAELLYPLAQRKGIRWPTQLGTDVDKLVKSVLGQPH